MIKKFISLFTKKKRYVNEEWAKAEVKDVFKTIHAANLWNDKNSVSGTGSNLKATSKLRVELPNLLEKLGVKTLLDIPCGDFHWMSRIPELNQIQYIGGDIVKELIDENRIKYGEAGFKFLHINLITDPLPAADAIFCRDCLVHLNYQQISQALINIANSNAEYLITTTFPETKQNKDITTGDWRPLNLQVAPFSLPSPHLTINEGLPGKFSSKSLGVWKISTIAKNIQKLSLDSQE